MTDKYLIIGGTSGIGATTAMRLQGPGHSLYVPFKNGMDVRYTPDIFNYIKDKGPFRYIVYSAGVNELAWISDMAVVPAPLVHSLEVNLEGFVKTVGSHEHHFPEAEVSIVAVSSDASEIPMRGSLAYCVSKAALDMAIRCAARELAPRWRVNGVAPGMVEGTPMTEYIDKTIPEFRGWTPEHAREYEKQGTPTGRRATLDEVAETIIWVLHGPAQMTGEIVKINGGR